MAFFLGYTEGAEVLFLFYFFLRQGLYVSAYAALLHSCADIREEYVFFFGGGACFVRDRVSLCSPHWPGGFHVKQVGLELEETCCLCPLEC